MPIELIAMRTCTDIIAPEPTDCPYCGAVAWWFRNYRGVTRCIACAPTLDEDRPVETIREIHEAMEEHAVAECDDPECPSCREWYKEQDAEWKEYER